MKNGISHPYHLDEATFISRVIRSYFSFLIHESKQNSPIHRILMYVSVNIDGKKTFSMIY